MKSCPAAGYQVDDAAERLGDTKTNPHGGEDDLSSNQTAAILQNTSADIAADLRFHNSYWNSWKVNLFENTK